MEVTLQVVETAYGQPGASYIEVQGMLSPAAACLGLVHLSDILGKSACVEQLLEEAQAH